MSRDETNFQVVQDDKWVLPKMTGYKMKCCDCGLVHVIDFSIIRKTDFKRNGWYKYEELTGNSYGVRLKARRL